MQFTKITKIEADLGNLTNSITDVDERIVKLNKTYDIIEDIRSLKNYLTAFRNSMIRDLVLFAKRDDSFYTIVLKLL